MHAAVSAFLLFMERVWEGKVYGKIKLFARTPLLGLRYGKWPSLLISNSILTTPPPPNL